MFFPQLNKDELKKKEKHAVKGMSIFLKPEKSAYLDSSLNIPSLSTVS